MQKFKDFRISIDGLASGKRVWAGKQTDGNFRLSEDKSISTIYKDEEKAFNDRLAITKKLDTNNAIVSFDFE